MSAATMKLRDDLVFSHPGAREAKGCVVKDPASGRFFRLGEQEQFIALQLDGEISFDEVRRRVEERFQRGISLEALERFVERLRGLGLLSDARIAPGHRPSRRVAGSLFYIRFKAFDPDKFFSRLVGTLQFLFTPAFVTLSSGLIILALGLTVLNWSEIQRESLNLLHLESLLVAWLVMLAVIALHEFAHGITCKHFGGQVHELGFMLIYFQPAFYCNVSDAWLFHEKRERLWVTFAGAYFEMFLWAISTVVWRLTDWDTRLNHLALVITATSAIKTFFNLNPLIKLDGYYLLSDWLEVPNLRQKAFRYLGALWRRPFGGTGEWIRQLSAREHRIYLIYGLLAAAYTYWILWIVLWQLGGYFTRRYEAWGFILFAALLTGIFRQPIQRSLRRLRPAANEKNGKLHPARVGKPVRWVLLIGAVGTALHFWPMQLRVSGEFTILPIRNADVCAEVEGFIQDIPHDEGDVVQKGDVIARLNERDVRAELDKVAAERAEKQANLQLLKAGARPQEIALARTAVAKAEERLQYSRKALEMDAALFKERLLSKREYQVSEEEVAVRQKEAEEATEHLKLLLAGARPQEIEALEAALDNLDAQGRYLQEKLRLLTVTSPVTGIIATHRLKEKIGQHVVAGSLIAAVHELEVLTAEIAISEKDICDVKIGQKVVLKARALPQSRFEGTVTRIAPVATASPENPQAPRTIKVMTQLANPALLLRPEMSGRARIYCGEENGLNLALRRFIRYFRVEFWSWW